MGLHMGGLNYGGGGLMYQHHLVLVIIFIVRINYIVNQKKYKHAVYNLYITIL
jgi:hypothetical protein